MDHIYLHFQWLVIYCHFYTFLQNKLYRNNYLNNGKSPSHKATFSSAMSDVWIQGPTNSFFIVKLSSLCRHSFVCQEKILYKPRLAVILFLLQIQQCIQCSTSNLSWQNNPLHCLWALSAKKTLRMSHGDFRRLTWHPAHDELIWNNQFILCQIKWINNVISDVFTTYNVGS